MSEASQLMEAVAQVARLCGAKAMEHFGGALEVEHKGDGSPVTIADRSAEQAARDWIGQHFPADGILGEEFGATRPDAARQWLLDPIDGTKTFVRGVPLWGSLVAVKQSDRVLAGAACFPALDELLVAAPARGCWWNGARCSVSAIATLANATVLTTSERFSETPARRAGWERLSAAAGLSRSWGDCYGYLLVATGRAEVMVDPVLSPWDCAVLQPLIEEAGGVFTDWDGVPGPDGRSAIATNALLANAARAALQETA